MTLFELDDRVGASMSDTEFAEWVVISGPPFHSARLKADQAVREHRRIKDIYSKMNSSNFRQLLAHIAQKEVV